MIRDRSKGIWARLTGGMVRRPRRPTADAGGKASRFGDIATPAPGEGQGDGLPFEEAEDGARRRAAFSQHIGS